MPSGDVVERFKAEIRARMERTSETFDQSRDAILAERMSTLPPSARQNRSAWIAGQGGCCARCGDTSHLEIDHVDPALKTMENNQTFSIYTPVEDRDRELANCQVLCKSCHRTKTTEDALGSKRKVQVRTHCPHGHEYDDINTYITPKGVKVCRECRRRKQRVNKV
jgi:5-methylcytosine-specific restriction endonuclease McrA